MNARSHSKYLPGGNWLWNGLAVAAIGVLIFFGDDLWRQIERQRGKIAKTLDRDSVESELERARGATAALIPDIRRNCEVIAREQVEVGQIRDIVESAQQELDSRRTRILLLRDRLHNALQTDLVSTTKTELRRDLRAQFESFQAADAALKAKLQILALREDSLCKAQAAQNELVRKKRELEGQLESLAAQVNLMSPSRIEEHIHVDREQLAHCEFLTRLLRNRLATITPIDEVGLAEHPLKTFDLDNDDVETEIDQYFAVEGRQHK